MLGFCMRVCSCVCVSASAACKGWLQDYELSDNYFVVQQQNYAVAKLLHVVGTCSYPRDCATSCKVSRRNSTVHVEKMANRWPWPRTSSDPEKPADFVARCKKADWPQEGTTEKTALCLTCRLSTQRFLKDWAHAEWKTKNENVNNLLVFLYQRCRS